MKNYQEWYGHVAGKIKNKPFLLSLLRAFNRFMTVVMPIVYLTLLATTYLQEGLGKQIVPLLDRDSPGQSMPSRHVFSATSISMACLHASLSVGVILLVLSVLLGLVRVLGGVHYPKDVLVGYACGLVWGVIFFLF